MPSVNGSASGLRSSACSAHPAPASAAPVTTHASTRGKRTATQDLMIERRARRGRRDRVARCAGARDRSRFRTRIASSAIAAHATTAIARIADQPLARESARAAATDERAHVVPEVGTVATSATCDASPCGSVEPRGTVATSATCDASPCGSVEPRGTEATCEVNADVTIGRCRCGRPGSASATIMKTFKLPPSLAAQQAHRLAGHSPLDRTRARVPLPTTSSDDEISSRDAQIASVPRGRRDSQTCAAQAALVAPSPHVGTAKGAPEGSVPTWIVEAERFTRRRGGEHVGRRCHAREAATGTNHIERP